MTPIRFVFHVHTRYSVDSASTPEAIVAYCQAHSIAAIAITDHNEFDGAVAVEKAAQGKLLVVKGEEIKTDEGEIIGLFLTKKIEPRLSIEATIKAIRAQGGIVGIPHPGESFRREAMTKSTVQRIINEVDFLEVFNSRTLLKKDNDWAYQLAAAHNLPMVIGADAHFPEDITKAINLIPNFTDGRSFLAALRENQLDSAVKQRTGLIAQLRSKIVKYTK